MTEPNGSSLGLTVADLFTGVGGCRPGSARPDSSRSSPWTRTRTPASGTRRTSRIRRRMPLSQTSPRRSSRRRSTASTSSWAGRVVRPSPPKVDGSPGRSRGRADRAVASHVCSRGQGAPSGLPAGERSRPEPQGRRIRGRRRGSRRDRRPLPGTGLHVACMSSRIIRVLMTTTWPRAAVWRSDSWRRPRELLG